MPRCVALLGNPNTGKTTLFNRICGIRAHTANFPGCTVEARMCVRGQTTFVDLPGIYGLNLDLPESRTCKDYLHGHTTLQPMPDVVLVVADATNLQRNLIFIAQAVQQGLPAVIALNLSDEADRDGLMIDTDKLEAAIGCPVIAISARSGRGVDALLDALAEARLARSDLPPPTIAIEANVWSQHVYAACVTMEGESVGVANRVTDRLDLMLLHPLLGILVFALIMGGLFYLVFAIAQYPMQWIETAFASLGTWSAAILPDGLIQDLLVDGVLAGIAGTVVFLPQICLLFLFITLLEDTGYLARAAFVTDRLLRRLGLPGQAFIPLLSAHACAIPAIMATKLIPDLQDRLATILIAPFMSCSARLPVYTLLVGLLFADQPLLAGLAFAGCYLLGGVVGLLTALLFRKTLLRGPQRPMVMELPPYRLPAWRSALLTMVDRGWVFLKNAGTVILAICIVLWWLGSYPKPNANGVRNALQAAATKQQVNDPALAAQLQADLAMLSEDAAWPDAELSDAGQVVLGKYEVSHSVIGRVGRAVEPVFRPMGADWQLSIGILTSFAAREVFVSTMAVVLSGSDDSENRQFLQTVRHAQRSDGSLLFTPATSAALLVFYVLAMQCLPTLAVTARQAGHWKWAALQLAYMSVVAYALALATFHGLHLVGVA
jgi:ferrous iron transport protein B